MAERHAAQMRADADQHQPLVFVLLHPRLVRLRIRKVGKLHRARLVNFLLGAVRDKHRLATPLDGDDLALGDRRKIHFDRREREHRRIRVHLVDERPGSGGGTDGADHGGRDIKKVSSCRLLGRLGRRHDSVPALGRLSKRAPRREIDAPARPRSRRMNGACFDGF
jgi:hypothetical protein